MNKLIYLIKKTLLLKLETMGSQFLFETLVYPIKQETLPLCMDLWLTHTFPHVILI